MQLRFPKNTHKLSESLDKECALLPDPFELEGESISREALRNAFAVSEEGILTVSDDLPPAVFGYMMFALYTYSFSLDEAEILTPRQNFFSKEDVDVLPVFIDDEDDDFGWF